MDFVREHWILSIILTVVLGAIGSGLREVAFRPFLKKAGYFLYSFFSFRKQRALDNVCRQAAKGHHELPSLFVLLFVIAALIAALLTTQATLYSVLYIESVDKEAISACEKIAETAEKRACVTQVLREYMHPYLPWMTLFSVFAISFLIFRVISMSLTNAIITHFEQCMRICAPTMSSDKSRQFEQAFALMDTKEAHKKIIDELNALATANGLKLPRASS